MALLGKDDIKDLSSNYQAQLLLHIRTCSDTPLAPLEEFISICAMPCWPLAINFLQNLTMTLNFQDSHKKNKASMTSVELCELHDC